MSRSSGSFTRSSSSACSSSRSDGGDNSFDVEELLQLGTRRRELRKEKDMLKESQPHSIELVRRLELHTKSLSESRLEDMAKIQTMEKELLNCYKEIDYLRDQLIFRNKEVNYLSEEVHGLKLKSGDLEEEVNCLKEELCMSRSEHLLLLQELEGKETEIERSSLSIEKLEETISSLTLESLCEIESMKLDITSLEEALNDAMKIQEESIQEKDQLRGVIEEAQSNVKYYEAMEKQIHQQEDIVKQLKDELKQEKLKAKEEAEDLAQEMAELRYKMTCLLDEERNRRVCIEQASLQRIAQLEAQIKRETKKPDIDTLHLTGL